MARITYLFIIFTFLSLPSFAESGVAIIKSTDASKTTLGKVLLEDTDEGLIIKASIEGISPGKHGIHIHQYGSCGDGGKDAGGHFNPDESDHGHVIHDGVFESHPGDLGNIEIQSNGSGTLSLEVLDLSLSEGLFNVAGRTIIVHEKEDDFGQPTGNAGARIGCGTIIITK